MLMSYWAMNGAVSQVRSINASLQGLVDELVSAGVWSGDDADRFARDWADTVSAPLTTAANTMDAIAFEPME